MDKREESVSEYLANRMDFYCDDRKVAFTESFAVIKHKRGFDIKRGDFFDLVHNGKDTPFFYACSVFKYPNNYVEVPYEKRLGYMNKCPSWERIGDIKRVDLYASLN